MKARFLLAAAGLFVGIGLVSGVSHASDDEMVEKGEKVFKKCKACHTYEQDGKNKVGPNLWGIIGRTSGTHEGFKYSDAMKEAAIVWDEAKLDAYLTDPKAFVPGNKMAFKGLDKPEDRQAVIAFLKHEAMPH